ncbi:peptidyl-prolyl cis-trans isomerase FKBP5 [Nerophis lumbriciformis]|uniref:peptidyl-prolyl cis-trans isomerase FKBP5 n=1 Tax=Nerophis lumbriciformis TaxID=546530 RepID=UPI002ADF97A3|nr:peptidyl-prolyl cis-trans isomerase FKBP5-like [Nerophis lumbriciformis]XP_061788846.1 peptidyl-prolyl cis-trans isomerase FKBP5-like [Nerophis lumbriciformis]XP_061788847.1 peptidyl-prolyl cis-trans isomerase FKBP5-like [Nerophis lumbriciformis]
MTTDQDLSMDGPAASAEFATKGVDVTPKKDQGIIKVVKRQGQDGESPMIGDKVTIHYTGKLLTGKKFDCSRDRKESFSFNVGKGQVLKAWDIGVLSMQRGEVCTILCKPGYAYGSTGNSDKIPPNSSVTFEIELLKFEGETLTEDGGIVRRIKVKGDNYLNPNDGATVEVHLEGSCDGRLFDTRDVTFVVSESEDKGVPLGVDRAMDKMQKGECCILHLSPKYGFGHKGKPEFKIDPDKDVVYEVTLKDFKRAKESWEMDLQEKLNLAFETKHKGNLYYKGGHYYQAVVQYQRIISWLEMECGNGLEQQNRINNFLSMAHLNLALCFLRIKDFSQVVQNCNKVIEIDPCNEKGLYRRGEARLLRNEFTLALADFQQVLQVNADNRAARTQISICRSKMKEYHELDKKTYANMFQKFAERDAKTGRTKRKQEESVSSSINGEVGIKRRRSQDRRSQQ